MSRSALFVKASAIGAVIASFFILLMSWWPSHEKDDRVVSRMMLAEGDDDEDMNTCVPHYEFRDKVKNVLDCKHSAACTDKIKALVALNKERGAEKTDFDYAVAMARERASHRKNLYPELVRKQMSTAEFFGSVKDSAKRKKEWGDDLFPDFFVVGLHKAGTSQLYNLLSSHSDVIDYHAGHVELCAKPGFRLHKDGDRTTEEIEDIQEHLYKFYDKMEHISQAVTEWGDKLKVNDCHFPEDIFLRRQYLGVKKTSKYILLLRDPADWLWAAWNFFVDPRLDDGELRGGSSAKPDKQYRSPELFHELIASANRTRPGQQYIDRRGQTVSTIRFMHKAFGKENVFVGRNEDMLPDVVDKKGGFLDRVSAFTGLSRGGFPSSAAKSIHNCNDRHGNSETCNHSLAGSYAITGHRPMFEKTRKLIYLHFHEECKIWKEELGVEYPDCLSAMPD